MRKDKSIIKNNIFEQGFPVSRHSRELLNGHKAKVIWFTGLSGSGKSTLANELEKKLHSNDIHTFILDGDNIRNGLNRDLDFSDTSRTENIRRISEVAKLMMEAGLIVITAFISPFRSDRLIAKKLIGTEFFKEIYVSTPLEVCEQRDTKGLYKKARKGEITRMTGIDSDYEPPIQNHISIDTSKLTIEESLEKIINYIKI